MPRTWANVRSPKVQGFRFAFGGAQGKVSWLSERRLERQERVLERLSEERERIEILSSCVPEASRLDRLLRYAASLERSFERALNQLERLQRNRLGKPVLPTLNVSVSA